MSATHKLVISAAALFAILMMAYATRTMDRVESALGLAAAGGSGKPAPAVLGFPKMEPVKLPEFTMKDFKTEVPLGAAMQSSDALISGVD